MWGLFSNCAFLPGGEISVDTMCDLLDLLCMYNSTDPETPLLPDEQFFKRDLGRQDSSKKMAKTWK